MTLENAVETAYASILRTYQTELSAIRINLASTGMDQVPAADDEGEQPLTQLPVPVIRLKAEASGEEEFRNSGAYAVELEITVEDAAVKPVGEGMSMDDLFALATRPLLYQQFPLFMDLANTSLRMHGINRRQSSMSQETTDAEIIRRKTATIHCALR